MTVGVVYEVTQSFQAELVDLIYSAAKGYKLDVILAGASKHHSELECARLLLTERCDGLILTGGRLSEEHAAMAARQLPVVTLCRKVEVPGVDGVYSDSEYCVSVAFEHFAGLGHRDIWYLGAADRSMGLARDAAYRAQMIKAGLEPVVIEAGGTSADGIRVADKLMALERRPSAVMCYNDVLAAGLVRRLRQHGVRVPEDLSVIGYDDAPVASDPTVDLTTVSQPHVKMTKYALDILAERMTDGGPAEPGAEQSIMLPGELVVRSTTGIYPNRACM